MTKLTLGSLLFDGIGVFPLAASRHEIQQIWASENEKAPISITKRHFPNIRHLGDITKVNGREIPPVHIITFGSPCQNLSNIGKREGLTGSQSSLFYHAIRIIEEMRCATNGTYPVIAVWENVMGAFSSNNRLDFKAVLESFTNTEIPMPSSEVWANAGMVRGNDVDVAWRLLDAQYWGRPTLAQRRRRIFLVADFGGTSATEILVKARDLQSFFTSCRKSRLSSTITVEYLLKKKGENTHRPTLSRKAHAKYSQRKKQKRISWKFRKNRRSFSHFTRRIRKIFYILVQRRRKRIW